MTIVILPEAEADLIEGYQFYEKTEAGVGDYFVTSLIADIDSLMTNAGGGHEIFQGYHRAISDRFPYAIFYKLTDDEITVHAVLDTRRDPKLISDRLN